jgi:N6-adenosine-specific RNA methylase IME4
MFPDKKYSVITVDPPWPIKKIQRKVRPNQIEMDYKTMSIDDIADLPINDIADLPINDIADLPINDIAGDNSVCFLWTIQKYLPLSFDILEKWGFKYQRVITWDKSNGMCLFGFHHRTECVLFGYKGTIDMYPKRKAFPTLISEKSLRHSQKPDCFYKYAELFGDNRIDIFARAERKGWEVWGDEIQISNDY